LGRVVGGWRGIGAAECGYNEVLALEVQNVVWLRRTKEKCKASFVCNGSPHVRCRAVVPGVLACVHMYILYVCVYICVRVYVCGHVYMYIYACVYVFVHLCVFTHVFVYVYAYLCIGCGSQYKCFSVWTVSCMRMCVHVHMYAYAYVCRYIYMCIFLQWVLHALYRLSTSAWAGVYVTQVCFYTNVHICEYTRCRLCTYVYMYICVYMHAYAYGCVCASMKLLDAYMCIFIYVCISIHMHMDAYVRLWYCLTRWGVVAKIFYLCIRVHMYANVYVCACIRV